MRSPRTFLIRPIQEVLRRRVRPRSYKAKGCPPSLPGRRAIVVVREFLSRSRLQIAFDIGIFFKGLDGVLEIVGGLLLFVVRPETVTGILTTLTQHELSKHPHDIIANQVARLAQDFSPGSEMFAGVYLLSHGVIKVVLVVSLFRGRLWAYPAAMVVFALFIAYQMYRYVLEPSTSMIVLSVLDVVVIVLTWLEYRRLKRVHGRASVEHRAIR
jgi:uncharacterized membrane protein